MSKMEYALYHLRKGFGEVYTATSTAQRKKDRCELISKKLKQLESALSHLSKRTESDILDCLSNFTSFLDELSVFITEQDRKSHKKNPLSKILKFKSKEKSFSEYEEELDFYISQVYVFISQQTVWFSQLPSKQPSAGPIDEPEN